MSGVKASFLGLLLLSALSAEAQTPSVGVQPVTQRIAVDSTTTVSVTVSGVQALHAYSVRVKYDPLLLRCTAVRGKRFLGSMSLFFAMIDSIAGEAGADEALLGAGGTNGTGGLLDLVFQGVRSGTSALHIATADLRDTANKPISVQALDGEIRVGDANGVTILDNLGPVELQAVSYPNPFNSSTTFSVRAGDGMAVVSIHSLLGVELFRREIQTSRGVTSTLVWNGTDQSGRALASGAYLYRVTFAGSSTSTRIMLLK